MWNSTSGKSVLPSIRNHQNHQTQQQPGHQTFTPTCSSPKASNQAHTNCGTAKPLTVKYKLHHCRTYPRMSPLRTSLHSDRLRTVVSIGATSVDMAIIQVGMPSGLLHAPTKRRGPLPRTGMSTYSRLVPKTAKA
jgi:hypothetical protein